MIVDKKYPVGFIDADSSPMVLDQTAILNMRNMRVATGDNGDVGYFRNIKSNKLLTDPSYIPAGSRFIGGAISPDNKFIVWITRCDSNHDFDQINYFDLLEKKWWLVIRNNMDDLGKVYGGLNFTSHIHSIFIIGKILYWTDNIEEPRKLHIGAAIRASYPGSDNTPLYDGWSYSWTNLPFRYVDKSVLTVISKPPAYPPTIVKREDVLFTNSFIGTDSFQFAWQYVYYSGEESVFSVWSESSMLNRKDEKSNVINVYLKQDDIPVPSSVRMIRLVVKIFSTKKVFEVNVWDREKPQDAAEIENFRFGANLQYNFYYNYIGEAVDDLMATKPFENVPRTAETIAFCKGRMFAGNTVEGYDTPAKYSSLQLRAVSTDNAAVELTKFRQVCYHVLVRYMDTFTGTTSYRQSWVIELNTDIPGVSQTGYYEIVDTVTDNSTPLDRSLIPEEVNLSNLTFRGSRWEDVEEAVVPDGMGIEFFIVNVVTNAVTKFLATDPAAQLSLLFNSEYHLGIVFYDKYLRKCGVVLPHNYYGEAAVPGDWGGRVYIPERTYNASPLYTHLEWTLRNDDAAAEIPEWAHYYAPVLKDKDRLNYFVSAWSRHPKYVSLDGAGGSFAYTANYSDVDTIAIALESDALVGASMGYNYTDGDIATLVSTAHGVIHLPVIGQNGKYIHLAPRDFGTIDLSLRFIYEIYTPVRSNNQQYFYEVGQLYPVLNPGQDIRSYSIISGRVNPDTYVMRRNHDGSTYITQAMSHDNYYRAWINNHGRINVLTRLGEAHKSSTFRFSNTWIAGTAINGLSAFESLNQETLPIEMGALRRLITTSKVHGEGDVMIAICENATASIYIGESELMNAAGQSMLVRSDRVVGQVNVLRGDYGTRNPESVAECKGNLFWYDRSEAAWLKYSANGLFAVSDSKLKGPTLELSRKANDGDLIIGGIDPFHFEYCASLVFADTDSEDYRMKMIGGRTVVFSLAENKSRGTDDYESEGFVSSGIDLFTFKDGHLWQQYAGEDYNVFFGNPVKSLISVAGNQGEKIKRFLSVMADANLTPDFTEFKTWEPNIQESSLAANEYTVREGVRYAGILRDKYSPNTPGDEWVKMYKGDWMVGPFIFCKMTWDTSEELKLKFICLNYKNRDGHE